MDKYTASLLQEFVQNQPSGVIVIYGPTGCGKTALSLEVAELIGSEIISVDARQIYRGLDIGTGKVTKEEMGGIPHHMLDVIDITESFSVVDYRNRVEEIEIWKKMQEKFYLTNSSSVIDEKNEIGVRGEGTVQNFRQKISSGDEKQILMSKANSERVGLPHETFGTFGHKSTNNSVGAIKHDNERYFPILCGGTGLYIDSLIYERDYMGEKPDTTRRDELEKYRLEYGNQALWEKLHTIDPMYADMLHVNNYTYIIRGIEVFEKTGRSKLEAQHGQKLKYPTLFLTPYVDTPENRKNLYTKINKRVEQMFTDGLLGEVSAILAGFHGNILQDNYNYNGRNKKKCYNDVNLSAGYPSTEEIYRLCPGLATIGYREVIEHLWDHISLTECISLVQQHNRNYAKRQITWNKKYE